MKSENVCINVLTNFSFKSSIIIEICAGLEEEGIPYRVQEDAQNIIGLGFKAASLSILGVGIGVSHDGKISIYHEKSPQEKPYITANWKDGRKMGQNAARLVKGVSLK